jgi:hypothetical protein
MFYLCIIPSCTGFVLGRYKYNGYGINQFLSLAGLIGSPRMIISNYTIFKKVWSSKPL